MRKGKKTPGSGFREEVERAAIKLMPFRHGERYIKHRIVSWSGGDFFESLVIDAKDSHSFKVGDPVKIPHLFNQSTPVPGDWRVVKIEGSRVHIKLLDEFRGAVLDAKERAGMVEK